MTDKLHTDTTERIEAISYMPGLQDSGDLEAGTRTITATAEAAGINNADYHTTLTLAKPDDLRVNVLRIAARLAVTIDSMTAGQLNCRVYADIQDADHRLFDWHWANAGEKLAAIDTHNDNLNAIFNQLKDGQTHTFYVFCWVNTGNAVISLCQLWEGVGTCSTDWWGMNILAMNYSGWVSTASRLYVQGNGPLKHMLTDGNFNQGNFITDIISNKVIYSLGETTCLVKNGVTIYAGNAIATDLTYLFGCLFVLRSEQ
jgi:hypothetical protein